MTEIKQNRPKYSLEFKQDAARLVLEKGYKPTTSCRAFGNIVKRPGALGSSGTKTIRHLNANEEIWDEFGRASRIAAFA